MADVFGTVIFTGGAVMALGSYFTHVFDIFKERTRDCQSRHENHADADKKETFQVFERTLNASSMQLLIGGHLL